MAMQIQKFYCLLLALSALFIESAAQTAPNSREPGSTKVFYAPHRAKTTKVKKVKKPNVKRTPRYEFYKRVEEAAREKQKNLKKLSKAQYSDRRYFGHKRIPKRRASYKMRYCEECGIRH